MRDVALGGSSPAIFGRTEFFIPTLFDLRHDVGRIHAHSRVTNPKVDWRVGGDDGCRQGVELLWSQMLNTDQRVEFGFASRLLKKSQKV